MRKVFVFDGRKKRRWAVFTFVIVALMVFGGVLGLQNDLQSHKSPMMSAFIVLFSLMVGAFGVYERRVLRKRSIVIEGGTLGLYGPEGEEKFVQSLDSVYHLHMLRPFWSPILPTTYRVYFNDRKQAAFESTIDGASELVALIEDASGKKFVEGLPTNPRPQAEPFDLSVAEERFGPTLVGSWSEPSFGSEPLEQKVIVFPDGYAVMFWIRMFGSTTNQLFRWRQTEPFVIEVLEVTPGLEEEQAWQTCPYKVEEFKMFETSRGEAATRGFWGSLMTFSGPLLEGMTYERFVAEHPLNFALDEDE
ncbi:MAG: hypothetical protein GC165_05660 [Armatimonadetes bacterium]|nr:hypothetical protein [Armatimonadota bacterium]MBS1727439.1 hypothetical protein [Armatimonadota bacterium]